MKDISDISTSGTATALAKGYCPKPGNLGRPLFIEREGISGLEGRTVDEQLESLGSRLAGHAREEMYQLLEDCIKEYRERGYQEGDEEEEQGEDEEEDILREYSLDELFELGRATYTVPGAGTRAGYDRTGQVLPGSRESLPDNKGIYNNILDYLRSETRSPDAGEGGIIFADTGECYGSKEDIAGADRLLQRYEAFADSEIGQQLFKDLGGKPKFDGYAFMNLGKGMLGAMVSVDGKKILAINKQYAGQLEGTAMETYMLAHEAVHGLGEKSEYRTDSKLYNSFSKAAANTEGPRQKMYSSLAEIGKQYTGIGRAGAGSYTGRAAAPSYTASKAGRARGAPSYTAGNTGRARAAAPSYTAASRGRARAA